MKLFQKTAITSILCLGGLCMSAGTVNAFWPFSCSCDDAQTCKAKFEQRCALIEEKEAECHEKLANLYSVIDKFVDDMRALKDAQSTAEGILTKLTEAYEEWKQDDFRIDTQYHTNYILLKKKFADQNRYVKQSEQLIKDDIKLIGGSLSTKGSKRYMLIL